MGDSETYTRLERDSFGVERMVTYNSAGECIGIADPVLDDEGKIRFVPRPDLLEGAQEVASEGASDGFSGSAFAGENPLNSETPSPGIDPKAETPKPEETIREAWWSNPKNTPALVIASVCAGAIFFLVISLVYRTVVNPTRPNGGSMQAVTSGSEPRAYDRFEERTPPPIDRPSDVGGETAPPYPSDPAPIDPNSGPIPNDLGPTDPAMDPTVPDPMLSPGEPGPEAATKPKESDKKPIDLRGDDDDSGASSEPPVVDPKKGTETKGGETKPGSGPDLRGGGE